MPVLIVDVSEVETTVDRSVIDSVVKNVLASTGISDTDVIINDSYGGVSQPESSIGEVRDVSFGNVDKVYVDVENVRNRNGRINRAVGRDYAIPFFNDTRYNIKLSPSMVTHDLVVTIRRNSPSKSTIISWLNGIQRKIDMGGSVLVTEADFHYHIPTPLLNLLAACYKTIYFNRTPDMTMLEYLKLYFGNEVTTVTNLVGADPTYVVRNRQVRLVGQFEETETKTAESDNNVSWIGEVTYTVSYDRPEAVTAMYPLLLRCTLLPMEWWPTTLSPGLGDYVNVQGDVFVEFGDAIIETLPVVKIPFILPECDMPEVKLPTNIGGYRAFIMAYLEFTESALTNPQLLFNLTELGDVVINDLFLEYIKLSYQSATDGADSIFRVVLYENNIAVKSTNVRIDPSFNVWFLGDIDLEKQYQVVVMLDINMTWINDGAFDFLRNSPDFVLSVLKDFNPAQIANYQSTNNGTISAGSLHDIQENLSANNKFSDDGFGMKTVLNGRLITYRGE